MEASLVGHIGELIRALEAESNTRADGSEDLSDIAADLELRLALAALQRGALDEAGSLLARASDRPLDETHKGGVAAAWQQLARVWASREAPDAQERAEYALRQAAGIAEIQEAA